MRCRKASEYISRSVDSELNRREAALLERHLASCADCRSVQADLRRIVDGAAGLETPEPSDKVWHNIRTGLLAGKSTQAGESLEAGRWPLFGWSVPTLRLAGAAAMALVLVAGGILIGSRLGREKASVSPDAGEKYTLAKLDEAERFYQQAIKSLSEAFASEKAALAPQVVELFERNLSVIDSTIRACRAAVLAEPEDLQARNFLLAAYTDKVTLLDSALDLQKQDREAVGKGKKII